MKKLIPYTLYCLILSTTAWSHGDHNAISCSDAHDHELSEVGHAPLGYCLHQCDVPKGEEVYDYDSNLYAPLNSSGPKLCKWNDGLRDSYDPQCGTFQDEDGIWYSWPYWLHWNSITWTDEYVWCEIPMHESPGTPSRETKVFPVTD